MYIQLHRRGLMKRWLSVEAPGLLVDERVPVGGVPALGVIGHRVPLLSKVFPISGSESSLEAVLGHLGGSYPQSDFLSFFQDRISSAERKREGVTGIRPISIIERFPIHGFVRAFYRSF